MHNPNGVHVFGLLHLAINEYSAVNLKVKNFSDQIKVYLSNASLLNKSFEAQGIKFTLLTNNKKLLEDELFGVNHKLNIVEIVFPTKVPSGVPFYSAHFKVDAFRYIASLNLKYAIFCDLDVVCLKPLPEVFETLISEGIPMVYEVTDQIIPADGHPFIIKNLEIINEKKSEGRWVGGEFMAGPSSFFNILTEEIDHVIKARGYFDLLISGEVTSGGGDEVYTNAAIEKMKRSGVYISEAGLINIIGRYWSSGPGFVQKDFKYFENVFLLHLPADKYFLQKMDEKYQFFDSKVFINEFLKKTRNHKIKSSPRAFLYFLFRVKAKTYGLRSIKLNSKLK